MTVETNNRYLYGAEYPFLKESLLKVGNPVLETYFALRMAREVYLPLGLHPGQRLLDVGCCLGHLGAVLGLGG